MTIFMLAVAAGLGACCRYAATNWGKRCWPGRPWATLGINLAGTAIFALTIRLALPSEWQLIVTTGFCGGLTTFSTFMADIVVLVRAHEGRIAAIYGLLTPVLGGIIAFSLL